MRFVDQYSALLLDMNGTFIFGHDRLGADEDYYSTYRSAGGSNPDRLGVIGIINAAVSALSKAYGSAELVDDFPSVLDVLTDCGQDLERAEILRLERVIALHEIGTVSPRHQKFLREIAVTHEVGVVSNLWSRPDMWRARLSESGLLEIFRVLVFSSEGRSIKPASALFDKALAGLSDRSRVLFAGDSLERDIIPAKALGLSTAWIAPPGSRSPWADLVVADLAELEVAPLR